MTDSQRNCFLAVAEHRSFSRAASALYVSQPAVSKNISTLEAELGVALFDRQGKYVGLTRAGEIFLGFLMEYRREFNSMIERIRHLESSGPYGTVRVGCSLIWNAAHFYGPIAQHLSTHFPGIHIEIEGLAPESFLPALRRKEVDLTIMYAYDLDRHPDIEARPLINIGTGFLCSSMLLGPERSDLEALMDHPFLIAENPTDRRNSSTYRQFISKIYKNSSFSPDFSYCRNLSAGLLDLSCGKGSLLVDDWTAAISNHEFRYIPTGETIPLCLASLQSNSDPLPNLVADEILKVFSKN